MTGKIRAAIWLGQAAPDTYGTVTDGRHVEAMDQMRRMSDDSGLMAGVLGLCDRAHENFERHGDPTSRAYMDAFSIELLGLVGKYLAARLGR